jgi:ABC-type nitrate/sulfonate/bicarbonate transport system permease component
VSKSDAQAAPVPRDARREEAQGAAANRTKPYVTVWNRPSTYRLLSVAALLTVWELVGPHIDPIFFTYPTAIAKAAWEMTASGELPKYALESMQILLYGMIIAVGVGIPLGVVMARFRKVDWLLDTYVNALYATPTVALVPLIVLWFGIRMEAKVFVVFLFAVFPVLINTYQGVKKVDQGFLEVARSFRSSEWQMWRDVLLPWAVPYITAGIRLAIGRALVGMIIAEFYTAMSGLGYMIVRYAHIFKMDHTFVPVILLMFLGVTLTAALKYVERRIAPWNRSED